MSTTHHLIGRTEGGNRLFVSIDLSTIEPDGSTETVRHQFVTEPYRLLTITGAVVDKSGKWDRCGQVVDQVMIARNGWDAGKRYLLYRLWHTWHLNDMRAACDHQSVIWEDSDYGRRPSLDLTSPCPLTGYRYGSAWLLDPLNEATLEAVATLQSIYPVDRIPGG